MRYQRKLEYNFTMIYSGIENKQCAAAGVVFIIDLGWKNKIDYYTYINERKLLVWFKIDRRHVYVIAVYRPQEIQDKDNVTIPNVV